jgi:hypothetical protein
MLNHLAQLTTKVFDEAGVTAAILLTMTGVLLQWYQPRHRMALEEKVKDGKVSDDEARRQILFYSRFAPVATLLGVAVLAIVLFDLVD